MKTTEVAFERPEDYDSDDEEDETNHTLMITFTLEIGIVLRFDTDQGELYSAEEYRQFRDGELKELTFNDTNGYTGIQRKGNSISFQNSHHADSGSFSIPANLCGEFFEKLIAERAKILKQPPPPYRDEKVTGVSLDVHGGELWMKSGSSSVGLPRFQKQHVADLRKMANGAAVEIVVEHQRSGFFGMLSGGGRFRTDGVHLYVGDPPVKKFDMKQSRYEQAICKQFFLDLANRLEVQ